MEVSPGSILDGSVKSITNFGAFVTLPENKLGLVHISEIASTYVADVRQHLTEGQQVRVKVLNVDPNGRISLSIKQAEPKAEAKPDRPARPVQRRPALAERPAPIRTEPETFEEKLKHFMADSNSKISGVRQYEHRTRSRKR